MDGDAARYTVIYEIVGERIRHRRDALHLKQEEVAKRVKLSRTSITNLERGTQRPPLHQLLSVATVLDVELRDLIPTRAEIAARAGVVVHGEPRPGDKALVARLLNAGTEPENAASSEG